MSWNLSGNPKTLLITNNLATKFANMEPAPQDRPLSEMRLRVYEKIANEGAFRPVQWASCYCKQTGGTYRVNGKHTSTLFSQMDPLPTNLYAVVEHYDCDTLNDVSRLYSTYDSKIQSRSTADINRSFAGCVPQLAEIDLATINACVSGYWFSKDLDAYARNNTPAERAEMLLEHHDFVRFVVGIVGRKCGSPLKRMPVVAAIYSTFVRAPRVADSFWSEVRDDTGAAPSDPTRKLSKFLLLNSGASKRSDGARRHRVKDKEFFVKSLHAWNAYREGVMTNLNYHADAKVPAVK